MNQVLALKAIVGERDHQDVHWGGKTHDQNHTLGDWILFMEEHLEKAKKANYDGDKVKTIDQIKKVAALGVAAMEYCN